MTTALVILLALVCGAVVVGSWVQMFRASRRAKLLQMRTKACVELVAERDPQRSSARLRQAMARR